MKSKIVSIITIVILIVLAVFGQYFYNKPEIDIKSDGYTIFEPEFKSLNLDGNK